MAPKAVLLRAAVDLILTAIVGTGVLLFFLIGTPYKRGFYCDDDSIRYPYKDSTVTNSVLYLVGISLPILVIVGGEFSRFMLEKRRGGRRIEEGRTEEARNPRGLFLACCYRYVGLFLFGAACSQFLTDVAKYSIGRLRPHFWDVCNPNVNCGDFPPHTYVEDYECTGKPGAKNDFRIRESRLSFVSGHASFSFYSMVFAAVYLQYRWPLRHRSPKVVRHFFQFVLIAMAWGTSLSRVSDYKHHPTDVLAGALLGLTVALLATLVVADRFRQPREGGGAGDEEGSRGPSSGNGKNVEMNSPVRR